MASFVSGTYSDKGPNRRNTKPPSTGLIKGYQAPTTTRLSTKTITTTEISIRTRLVPTTVTRKPVGCILDTVTTTKTSIIPAPTITITEQYSCPTPTPTAALPQTTLETNLSPSLYWSIYTPLVAIAMAIVGSHIYFKHQTFLLKHKKLDKEIESIKVNKEKEVELQNIKAGTAVAVEKIKATNSLGAGEVQGEVVGEGVRMRYRLIPGTEGAQ